MESLDAYFTEFSRLKHDVDKESTLVWLFEYAYQHSKFDEIDDEYKPSYITEFIYKKLDDLLIVAQRNYDYEDVPTSLNLPPFTEIKDVVLYERQREAVRLAELPCYDVSGISDAPDEMY